MSAAAAVGAPEDAQKKGTVKEKRWLPLESDPELMNTYIHSLGVPKKFRFVEILGFDEVLLSMVPRPVHAVLMLFPISPKSEEAKAEQEKRITSAEDPQKENPVHPEVYFLKQRIGNACGTIGLLHGILNSAEKLDLEKDGFFAKFWKQTKDMSVDERVKALEENEDIEETHEIIASAGSSEVSRDEEVNLHFNAFTCVQGHLYELDGRKKQPINHGPCEAEQLLEKAVEVIKKEFVALDPEEIRWNLVALAEADE